MALCNRLSRRRGNSLLTERFNRMTAVFRVATLSSDVYRLETGVHSRSDAPRPLRSRKIYILCLQITFFLEERSLYECDSCFDLISPREFSVKTWWFHNSTFRLFKEQFIQEMYVGIDKKCFERLDLSDPVSFR